MEVEIWVCCSVPCWISGSGYCNIIDFGHSSNFHQHRLTEMNEYVNSWEVDMCVIIVFILSSFCSTNGVTSPTKCHQSCSQMFRLGVKVSRLIWLAFLFCFLFSMLYNCVVMYCLKGEMNHNFCCIWFCSVSSIFQTCTIFIRKRFIPGN